MLALINDGGKNTAAEIRDVIEALYEQIHAPFLAGGADDVLWNGDLAGLTKVEPTGTATATEQAGFLSVLFSGSAASDFTCWLKPVTFAIGDQWVLPTKVFGLNNHNMAGLCFTDGVVAGSNIVAFVAYVSSADSQLRANAFHGTITNAGTAVLLMDGNVQLQRSEALYLKLGYSAANTFQHFLSPDGVSFSRFGASDISKTMTPTHVGVCVSKFGGAADGIASFGPLGKVA